MGEGGIIERWWNWNGREEGKGKYLHIIYFLVPVWRVHYFVKEEEEGGGRNRKWRMEVEAEVEAEVENAAWIVTGICWLEMDDATNVTQRDRSSRKESGRGFFQDSSGILKPPAPSPLLPSPDRMRGMTPQPNK